MLPAALLFVLLLEPAPKRDPMPLTIPKEPDPELPLEFDLLLEFAPCCVPPLNPKPNPNPTLPEPLPELEPLSNLPFNILPNPGMLPEPELELESFLVSFFEFDPAPIPSL